MHNGIDAWLRHVVVEQVFQTIAADDTLVVVEDGQAGVEVGIVLQHVLHKLHAETEVGEERGVGLEEDVGAVFFLCLALDVADELSFFKRHLAHLSLAAAAGHEAGTQGIDGLEAHAVHTDGSGEDGGVVFCTRVELRNGSLQGAEGNATAIVAHLCGVLVQDVHLDAFAETFVKFVDTVVDGFLEQHIDTIFGVRTVAKASDIHTGTLADVGHVVEMADFALIVVGSRGGLDVCVVFFLHCFL